MSRSDYGAYASKEGRRRGPGRREARRAQPHHLPLPPTTIRNPFNLKPFKTVIKGFKPVNKTKSMIGRGGRRAAGRRGGGTWARARRAVPALGGHLLRRPRDRANFYIQPTE
ncbi:hypothetical protein EVAR_7644_1 [Eumeta japonica]|uniref:Uncharacterized protein n=1 Tax=Eumeta variegata TaxID=151549 RepID=A0A4C1TLF7_EUMVA|nr:hypothetical protein EVAR_7644_1 [Eumeta japonica]